MRAGSGKQLQVCVDRFFCERGVKTEGLEK